MESRTREIFNESILLERNAAEFYWLLMNHFHEDAAFWGNLKSEEEHHAGILNSGMEDFIKKGYFPVESLEPDLVQVQKTNSVIEEFMRIYKQTPPALEDAYKIALMLEGSSVEHYFRLSLDFSPAKASIIGILRSITENEMNHAKRVADRYMQSMHSAKQKKELKKSEHVNSAVEAKAAD